MASRALSSLFRCRKTRSKWFRSSFISLLRASMVEACMVPVSKSQWPVLQQSPTPSRESHPAHTHS